ncbi:hypothetical protein Daus18300_007347 [Diaporthe australafricana]|uniref:Rieske domain-containing protein n=1 Tax=Diaporthe australafricana TaxID=127596 RepID=A0ABR3WMX4_9PEZI
MNEWLGFGKTPTEKISDKTPTPALPSVWYRSPELYELERRAIFSRKWLLVSHKLRLLKVGDFVRITEAGFQFFLIKDREGNINAFHNICRHRAYPIIERDCGSSSILACKYHGWSYSFKGALAKAPKYQDLDGFDKDRNGLFRIHVHIDELGFIWVNLDSNTTPGVSWKEDFQAVDCQPRLQNFDFSEYHFDHQWEMLGKYNWKTLADNYNEMEYEVYRHKDATDEEFTYITETFKTILKEDKDLCNAAQKNLNGNVFINGELHPMAEKSRAIMTKKKK